MKKSILLGIVGIAAAMATSSYGQGAIRLSNYVSSLNPAGNSPVMWRDGSPLNVSGYTVGFYWAAGNVVSSLAADPTAENGHFWGESLPTSLYSGFQLATGLGSTAQVDAFFGPGTYDSPYSFNPGAGAGQTITIMLVAYNGASYATSFVRGHSLAFTMTTSTGTNFPQTTGGQETDGGFAVTVPEPATMALGGLGLAGLLLFRRKQV